jgi:hypothetical protein
VRHRAVAAPESFGRFIATLRPWAESNHYGSAPCACGVEAPQRGWLAMIEDEYGTRLVGRIGRTAPTTNPATVGRAVSWLAANEEHWLPVSWTATCDEVERWIARQRGRRIAGVARPNAARVRGRELASAMSAMARSHHHERARVAASATESHLAVQPRAPSRAVVVALVVFCRRERNS